MSDVVIKDWLVLPTCEEETIDYRQLSETLDWGMKVTGVPQYWRTTKGKGIKIGILDTGIASQHPDLRLAIKKSKDFTRSRSGVNDVQGHGTHVAGTVGARQNSTGVVGAAPESDLYIAKVLGDNGSGSDQSVAAGIDWCIQMGVDIISMSLGSPRPSNIIHAAVKRAHAKGIFIIAAAGNDGPRIGTEGYPAKYPEVISVGAIDRRLKVAKFSSRGNTVDIVAPGDQILSTYPPKGFAKLSGTSMATPLVSGIVALLLAHDRMYNGQDIKNNDQLKKILRETAIDIDRKGFDPNSGFGLINPKKLIEEFDVPSGSKPEPKPEDPSNPDAKALVLNVIEDLTPEGQKKVKGFVNAGGSIIKAKDEKGNVVEIKV
jgi:subtilisin family serine protease